MQKHSPGASKRLQQKEARSRNQKGLDLLTLELSLLYTRGICGPACAAGEVIVIEWNSMLCKQQLNPHMLVLNSDG
jgi:hypothetical protein